ncbi:hypothetical protein GPALN_014150 [Globodera pallida]|nr:hypothetical protein GPALN_014150 [Globodera pallida]
MIILLTIIVALLQEASCQAPPLRYEPKHLASFPEDIQNLCVKHQTDFFKMLHEPLDENSVLSTDKEMHDINAPWLSILLGKYLCDKLVKGKTDSSVDFKKEKSVWTPVAVVKKGDTDLVDPHGFSVRAQKLFTLITNKFGITDMALLKSLSDFLPLLDRGGCNGVFYITKDSKYIVKWVNDRHGELEKMDEVLDKYVQYVLTKGENSMMNRFHLNFKMTLYAKLRENKMNVIKLKKLQFVVLNNTFYGIEPEKLLKFDIKGTFSPGSAVQYEKNQIWYSKNKAKVPEKSTYREYDFMGIARGVRDIKAFFKNGIELDKPEYTRLTQALHNDAQYLSANELNDYSLLLGVHFLDEAPKKNDNNCIHATCRDCKRLPDAVYNEPDEQQHLCLYMAIVDIVTPSTKEAQEHFITTMADFNGFQLETVSPIPAPQYVGRFLGTVLGCIFRPALSPAQANNNQILMNGLSQGICHSFGEERNTFVEKHDTFVKKMEKISDEKKEKKEEKQWNDWGVALYAFEQFKEEMDKRKMPSWDLLVSMSQTPDKFINEPIEKEQFVQYMKAILAKKGDVGNVENVLNVGKAKNVGNVGKDEKAPFLQRYYAIFSHKQGENIQKYYGLVRAEENPHAGKRSKKQ